VTRRRPESTAALDPARHLLAEHRYDEAATLVRRAARQCDAAGEHAEAELLSAAYELCLTCREHHDAAEAHGRALMLERDRESKLRDRVTVLLRQAGPEAGTRDDDRATPVPGRLEVRCLGPFRVDREGERLGPWPNRRATAVFKHLVLDLERPLPREVLMDHLWPDADGDAARNSLNVAVHALRRFLRAADVGPSQVVFHDGCYALDPALDVWVDVAEFRRLAQGDAAALQCAAALYRGPLFEDDPYEEWTLPIRREVEQVFVGVLDRLRRHHLHAGQHEAAVAVAEQLLALEPFREDAHRDLMRSYARHGQEHLALRQFQVCVTDLREHLDAEPADETRGLRDRIRHHLPV
jgi:DNA-binding SARP family transcriptional activator